MDNTRFSAVRKGHRGVFDLNKMHTSTTDFFRWDVVHCMPLVPNDSVNISVKSFIDSAPNPFPINGSCSYGLYAFYVPNRIVWDDWPNYIYSLQSGLTPPYFTPGDLLQAVTELVASVPSADQQRFQKDIVNFISNIDGLSAITRYLFYSDFDQMDLKLSAMPLRMIQCLWFDTMRDKNHISDNARPSYCLTTGGHITIQELKSLIHPKYRCWPKNYITTSFDSPQEGSAVVVPVAVLQNDSLNPGFAANPDDSSQINVAWDLDGKSSAYALINGENPDNTNILGNFNINQLREKNSLIQFAERILVAGKTRVSRALALLGVSPTIEELQMADYIGGHEEELLFKSSTVGASTRVANDSTILVNSGSFGYNPAGGTAAGQKFQNMVSPDNGFGLENIQYKTDEDGYIFIMGCLVPHPQYYQGLPRNWTRGLSTFASDVFDYFHQDFENQPLQPVLNYEVCCNPEVITDLKGVFGFNQNYLDYKMSMDSIAGDFVSPYTNVGYANMHLGRDIDTLIDKLGSDDHPAQEFLTPEVLTQATMLDEQQFDSKFTITSPLDHFIVNHKIKVRANRPMQQVSLPSLDSALSAQTSKTLHETGGFRL